MRSIVKRDRAFDSTTGKVIFVWELDDYYELISKDEDSED